MENLDNLYTPSGFGGGVTTLAPHAHSLALLQGKCVLPLRRAAGRSAVAYGAGECR